MTDRTPPSSTTPSPSDVSAEVTERPKNGAEDESLDNTSGNKTGKTTDTALPPPRLASTLKRAQTSLKQTLKRYSSAEDGDSSLLKADLQQQLEHIAQDLQKLENGVLRIAVFGLVSRGKSSVINALVEQNVLQTGPLHGVTKWPRSVYWEPQNNTSTLKVEFIDTPGLDEVDGTIRADMANEVAQEADLILFVLAGEITPIEYQALVKLLTQRKPLMIVCNKMDLYPDQSASAVLSQLRTAISQQESDATQSSPAVKLWQLTSDDIVQSSAAPTPVQVRVEWPDGQITHEWENPPAQIDNLSQRLSEVLHKDGPLLIALNALRDSQVTEAAIAETAMQVYDEQAEELLWQFAKWKGLAVAANPLAILDVAGGIVADLVMIRSLARLYGLPMTGYDAGALWNAIVRSSGGLLAAELGSKVLLGIGKTTALTTGPVGGLAAYSSTAIAQATLAGYGTYKVGKAAQVYLQQGCTWGPNGASTVLQTILDQANDTSIMDRLKSDIRPIPFNSP